MKIVSKSDRPAQARRKEELIYDHDGRVDVEAMREERGEAPTQFTAPGAELKWRARDLVDIHWNLTGIKTPSESYNRIMSCIIGHANPNTGACYPRQKLIAAETGYHRETVKRAVKWWVAKKFLVVESRGLGRANSYHPQWALFDVFYAGVAHDIAEQKEAWSHSGNQSRLVAHQGEPRGAHQGAPREAHHAAPHESQSRTSKNESQHEVVRPPSASDTTGEKEKGFSGKESVINLPRYFPDAAARRIVQDYMEEDPFVAANLPSREAMEAATVAEMKEPGSGRAIIQAAANQTWKARRSARAEGCG